MENHLRIGCVKLLLILGGAILLGVPSSVGSAASLPLPARDLPDDSRELATDLDPQQEIVANRTPYSATFQNEDGSYTTVISAEAIHYQDEEGSWQPINPAFTSSPDGFIVEHNSLQSQVGLRQAWLGVRVRETAAVWEATAVGTAGAEGFQTWAEPLEEGPLPEKLEGGTVLHYAGSWSDPTLAEQIISAPDSVEHALVLDAPPPEDGAAEFLELQATLDLLPGASLWANGSEQSTAFSTGGRIEVRDETGHVAFVFNPVIAYEQENRETAVAGVYNLEPGEEDGQWLVSVRTPYSWWRDPDRHYPAVLDPTIEVKRTDGFGFGMAWINSSPDENQFRLGILTLGAVNFQPYHTKGFLQFNSMPGVIQGMNGANQVPLQIEKAYLDLEPTALGVPGWKHKKGSYPNWHEIVHKRPTKVYYIDEGYSNPNCPVGMQEFSMLDDRLTHSCWTFNNSPASVDGTYMGEEILQAGPVKKKIEPITTTWDVTNKIRDWYANQYAIHPMRLGPTFMVEFADFCKGAGPYNYGKSPWVPGCTVFDVALDHARLRIEYNKPPLQPGDNFLNYPGVPSFLPDVFEQESTHHQFDLDSSNLTTWRGVAVRGNHAVQQTWPTRANLRFLSGEEQLSQASGEAPDQTVFMLMDGYNASSELNGAPLTAAVTSSSENSFSDDQQRNYRLEYAAGGSLAITSGQWYTGGFSLRSDQLIGLAELDLEYHDSILITADGYPGLDLFLVQPTGGSGLKAGLIDKDGPGISPFKTASSDGTLRIGGKGRVDVPGKWVLAVVNQDIPEPGPGGDPDNEYLWRNLTIRALRCPAGAIPTYKHGCQPIRMPTHSVYSNPNTTQANLPTYGLRVYSPAFDVANPDETTNWCTTGEENGTPLIENTNLPGPDTDKWVAVVQGHLCYTAATKTLYTEADSALILTLPDPALPGEDLGGYSPDFTYGRADISPIPAGQEDGQVFIDLDSDPLRMEPTANTMRYIEPFALWTVGGEYKHSADYIDLADMKFRSEGQIDAQVTYEASEAPIPISWSVPLSMWPNFGITEGWGFELIPAQQSALPQPLQVAGSNLTIFDEGFNYPGTGIFEQMLALKNPSGPMAYQFFAQRARLTHDPELGGASKYVTSVIQPPGKPLLPQGDFSCGYNNVATSCLDLRHPQYQWDNGNGKKNPQPWELPDIVITGQAATVAFATDGELNVYSNDHPLATQAVDNVNQSFAFETWGVTAKTSQGPCTPGGPNKTIIEGSGYIALPMMGSDGSGPGPHVKLVNFTLCDNALRQAEMEFGVVPTPIPVGSTGFGVDVIGGEITVGPKSTTVALNIGLLTQDRYTVTKGDQVKNGTVTIDTAGLFSMKGSGLIVGKLDADYQLDISWDPLDVLTEGDISYGGGLITGFMRLHGWFGQGWQNKYSYLPDNNDFHFTGTIGATIQIKKGQLIDKKYLKVPWFNAGISADVAFGEFCSNSSSCLPINWGMSATVKVFGYGVGVYVDKYGPEIFLGSSGKVLVDQCINCGALVSTNVPGPEERRLSSDKAPNALLNFATGDIPPGAAQPYLERSFPDPFAGVTPSTICSGEGTSTHTCPFYITTSTHKGRAMFTASWLNGDLDVSLVDPNGVTITPENAAEHHVTITPFVDDDGLRQGVNFVVNAAAPGGGIPLGYWTMVLDGVALDPEPYNYYSLSMVTDPPPPTVLWTSVLNPQTTPVNDNLSLTWQAKRVGQNLEPGVTVDLFYAPVYQPPIWEPISVSFPGSYMDEAGLGTDWDAAEANIQAGDPNHDGIWRIAADVPAGEYSFLVARNGALEEYYGQNGLYHGQEISFTVPISQTAPVIFMYDPRDNVAMADTEHPVVNLVGDMMSTISPPSTVAPDWNPANLVGWMKPGTDADTFYETTLQIPEGQYLYKIALNESWDENYGAGGVPDGPDIPLEVPDGGALVRFTFDYATKEINHEFLGGTPGTMITRLSDPNAGAYNWLTYSLTDGEYRVGLRIDDHFKGNGQIISWAPGTVLIEADSVPPPVPVLFATSIKKDAIDVFWGRDDSTLDLAGYLIEYDVPGPEPDTYFTRSKRMVPLPASFSPFTQHTRLGGLLLSDPDFVLPEIVSSICVRAYDVHGNISGCNAEEVVMPISVEFTDDDQLIGPPQNLIVQNKGDGVNAIEIEWTPPAWGTPRGYLVSYAPTGCLIADAYPAALEGLSPINVHNVNQYFLNDLVQDQSYIISVQAYTTEGALSEPVTGIATAGNRVDSDNNGLPDIWAEIYGIEDPNGDVEGDGLSNYREAVLGANPFNSDSDFDGHYDGAEVAWGTDVCSVDQPPYQAQGKLTLSGPDRLSFTVSSNLPESDPQAISIFNMGQGTLDWIALPSDSWIQLSQTSGQDLSDLQIWVDATGLQWWTQQEYEGSILIVSTYDPVALPNGNIMPGITESFTIPVKMTLLPPVDGVTQAVDLNAGWSLISSYIAPGDTAVSAVLSNVAGDLVLVKNENGEVYWPAYGVDQIGNWDVAKAYQLYMAQGAALNVTGTPIDPAQTPLNLPEGWNMVPYLRKTVMPSGEALATLEGSLFLAKNGDGQVYWPEMDIDEIGNMQPGQGYQMYMAYPGTLTYPAN